MKKYDAEELKYTKSLEATVERTDVASQLGQEMIEKLDVMGQRLGEEQAKGFEYVGSAAVHIYVARELGHSAHIIQTKGLLVNQCPFPVARDAVTDLAGRVAEAFGHKVPKLRNGW